MTEERGDHEPESGHGPAHGDEHQGGFRGWRARHRQKLLAKHEEAGDARAEEEELQQGSWNTLGKNPPIPPYP
ncbi:MAG: hypothetical protein WAL04_17780 [Acidimicrobiales bacterium]